MPPLTDVDGPKAAGHAEKGRNPTRNRTPILFQRLTRRHEKKTPRRESPIPSPSSHNRSCRSGCCKMPQPWLFAAVFRRNSSTERSLSRGDAIRVPTGRKWASVNEKRRGRSRRTDPASHGGTLFISVSLACRSRVPDTTNPSPTLRGPKRRLQRKGKVFVCRPRVPNGCDDGSRCAAGDGCLASRRSSRPVWPRTPSTGRERHRPPAQFFSENPPKISPRPANHLSHQATHPIEKGDQR